MRILIAAIGKPKSGPEQALVEMYVQRMGGRQGWDVQIAAFESGKATAPQRQQQEAEWLLAQTADYPLRIALDEKGKTYSSADFARRMEQWQLDGQSKIAFLIGGADGHTAEVRQACQLLSLSAMTLPHLLARAVLAEQLYRAYTILQNHPYHRA